MFARTAITITFLALMQISCVQDERPHRLVGMLESDRVEVSAEYAEPVIARPVAEGEQVAAGQLLFQQDTARSKAALAEAEAALRQTQARLDELIRGPRRELILAAQAGVRGAEKELAFLEGELQRAQEIYDRKLSSAEARDRAIAARDSAQANLDTLTARLDELLSGTTGEEIRQAEQAVRQAEAHVSTLQINDDRHSIKAPVAGVVDTLLFEVGERPLVGQPLAILLSGEQVYARVYVPEEIRVQVRPGMQVEVFVDGLDGSMPGRVRWVSADAAFTPYYALTEADRGRLSYVAKVDIEDTSERLPDGIPVEVEVVMPLDARQ